MCVPTTYYKTHPLRNEQGRCLKAAYSAQVVKCWISKFDSSWFERNLFFIIVMIDSLEATDNNF